jgi:hypothetical protein
MKARCDLLREQAQQKSNGTQQQSDECNPYFRQVGVPKVQHARICNFTFLLLECRVLDGPIAIVANVRYRCHIFYTWRVR